MYLEKAEGMGKPPAPSREEHVHHLLRFGKEGFDTTKEFREAFAVLNHYFVKKGKVWTADVFRNNFCKAKHYAVFGEKVALVRGGFPVKYREQEGRSPLLIDIGNWNPNFPSRFKGKAIKPPLLCKP